EMGINLGLGTDGASSNNNLNFMEEIHLATMVNKGYNFDPGFMSTKEILKMATINGAKSQGRENCGSLKMGNQADFIVVDMNKSHLQPIYDYLGNIIYSAQASDICLSVVDGEIIYKDGELTNIDEEKVIYQCNKSRDRILSEL
ncbi:MAG: amidohydrolase family protein, partial [Tissierellia bacterium]|nr:amidohydrolase family protein [Tissierellia bacterium]